MRFLVEANDRIGFIDRHHAEGFSLLARHLQRGDGQIGFVGAMLIDHRFVVHFVDVVAGEDQHFLGTFFFDGVNILVDGVGGALVPIFVDPLLGRHHVDEFAQFAAEISSPAVVDVAVEADCFVLRQQNHLPQAAVKAV